MHRRRFIKINNHQLFDMEKINAADLETLRVCLPVLGGKDDVDEFKLYYNGEIILHACSNENIEKCKDYPLQLYVKTINKTKNIYRLDNSENNWDKFDSKKFFENKLDSPFLQVELKQGGEKFLLDKGLSDFYFNGNKILDEIFLKWFLNYYNYGIEL